jgi:serine O-acetyltransferase
VNLILKSGKKDSMTYSEFCSVVREDLYRYNGKLGIKAFAWAWRYEAGFRFSVWMRLTRYLYSKCLTRFGIYHIANYLFRRASVRHGLHIHYGTDIGGGLYIPHALNIVINNACRIGRNCSLSHGVTLGAANRGSRVGSPTIGDSVYIAPGAVVFGAISVGDNAAIGSNCVVTKDVPSYGVVVGVPGQVISLAGSQGYVSNTI